MKIKNGLLILSAMVPIMAYGTPEIMFNAEIACQAQETTAGIRYVPPCEFTPQTIFPEQYKILPNDSYLLKGLFKSTVRYYFNCESLRPLSISYSMNEGETEVVKGNVAGSIEAEILTNTITHGFDLASFRVLSFDSTSGFQAMKPGCEMGMEDFISYPEPEYFKLMADSQINLDRVPLFRQDDAEDIPHNGTEDFMAYLENSNKLHHITLPLNAVGEVVRCNRQDPISLEGCSQPVVQSFEPRIKAFLREESDLYVEIRFSDVAKKIYRLNYFDGQVEEIENSYPN